MTPEQALRRCLSETPLLAERPPEAWHAIRLPGLTNTNWRLRADGQDLVLRIPGSSSKRYLSREQEMHNAGLAAELGIAPPLLYADPASGVTVQKFLADARSLTPADFAEPETLRKIGALLAQLHRSDRRFEGSMAPFPIIDTYLGLASDARLLDLRRRAEPIRAVLEGRPMSLVPSHIDPNSSNFLLRSDGRLLLIDWEFSAMAEPAWDLAAVVIEANIGSAVEALFQGYGGRPDAAERCRLWLMRAALYLVAGSWTFAEIAGGNPAQSLPALLDSLLSGLEAMLADPELPRYLGQAA